MIPQEREVFHGESPNPFPIRRYTANVATVVVSVVVPLGHVNLLCASHGLVKTPLSQQRVVAKGTNQRRAILAQLLRVYWRLMPQQFREERGVATLWMPVQHPRQRKVAVQATEEAVN